MATRHSPRTQAGIDYYAQLDRQRNRWRTPLESLAAASIVILASVVALDLGRIVMTQHAIDNAAYEAARAIIVPGAESDDARKIAQHLVTTAGIREFDIRVSPTDVTDSHGWVRVDIAVPYLSTTWCLAHFRDPSSKLCASSTILTERFAPTLYQAVSTLATNGPSAQPVVNVRKSAKSETEFDESDDAAL